MSSAGAGAGAGAGAEPNRFEAASMADRTREPRRDNRQHHGGNNNSGGGRREHQHGSGGGAGGGGRSGVKGVPNDVVEFIVSFHSAVKRGNVFGASRWWFGRVGRGACGCATPDGPGTRTHLAAQTSLGAMSQSGGRLPSATTRRRGGPTCLSLPTCASTVRASSRAAVAACVRAVTDHVPCGCAPSQTTCSW